MIIIKRNTVISVLLMMLFVLSNSCNSRRDKSAQGKPADETIQTLDLHKGWHLGIQAWTFHKYSFFETLEKVDSLGLHLIEAYPGQQLYPDNADVVFIHTMDLEHRAKVKVKLRESGIRLVNYGVVDLPNNEAECRTVFEFAREMGIETIIAEPALEAIGMIDSLCREYKIKVAIHNHPKPSLYWFPEAELAVFENTSGMIGSCADVGHWARMNIDPVEALRLLKGHIICLHLKDVKTFGDPEAEDVVFGRGEGKFKEILTELKRQNFQGVFSIEYEANWYNSMPDIRECIEVFHSVSGDLSAVY